MESIQKIRTLLIHLDNLPYFCDDKLAKLYLREMMGPDYREIYFQDKAKTRTVLQARLEELRRVYKDIKFPEWIALNYEDIISGKLILSETCPPDVAIDILRRISTFLQLQVQPQSYVNMLEELRQKYHSTRVMREFRENNIAFLLELYRGATGSLSFDEKAEFHRLVREHPYSSVQTFFARYLG